MKLTQCSLKIITYVVVVDGRSGGEERGISVGRESETHMPDKADLIQINQITTYLILGQGK